MTPMLVLATLGRLFSVFTLNQNIQLQIDARNELEHGCAGMSSETIYYDAKDHMSEDGMHTPSAAFLSRLEMPPHSMLA